MSVSSAADGQDAGGQDAGGQSAVRGVSRKLATGVCVLTVARHDLLHGGTASTTSIVAQRPLTICVSLGRGSYLARLAMESRQFACNVLSARQALVADWFADPGRPPGARQFEMVQWDPDPGSGIPLLRGALAHLLCRVTGHVPLGDHNDILLAEVTGGTAGPGRPLVSFGGQLHDAELHDVIRRPGWHAPQAPELPEGRGPAWTSHVYTR